MRVWMDDEREPPTQNNCGTPLPPWDAHCKHAHEALKLLYEQKVTYISLDHWMWSGELNGMDVAKLICEGAKSGSINRLEWDVHTGDREKYRAMTRLLMEADKAWDMRERAEEDYLVDLD